MIGRLSRQIEQNWRALGLSRPPAPSEQRWLVMNGGIGGQSKLVCLLWAGAGACPGYVVKFARYPVNSIRVEAEYRALQALQLYVPKGATGARRYPEPLLAFYLNDLLVTVETAIPGRSLRHYLREHPRRHLRTLRNFSSLAEWLAAVQSISARPATGDDMRALVFEPLEAAAGELGDLSVSEMRGFERLRELAEEMAANHTLPLVFAHNDLGATNIIVDDDGAFEGVVDWEFAAPGLPLLDLFYFLSAYGYETREAVGGELLRGFRELFFLPESTGAGSLPISLSDGWISAYLSRLGIDPNWLPLLFGLTWLLHARNEKRRDASGQWAMGSGQQPAKSLPTGEAHFRSRLRYFLENWDASLVARMAGGSGS